MFTAGAAAVVALTLGLAGPASAGPFDPASLAVTGGSTDFGYQKTGTTVTHTITLTNDGSDSIRVDPAPLSGLVAPFKLVSTTVVAGALIDPGQTRNVQVSYAAPAAGTVSNQPVTLNLVNATGTATVPFTLTFSGTSLATDRAWFALANPSGGATVAFGRVTLGTPATVRMKITVQGIDPLRFTPGDITMRDDKGAVFPAIKVIASTFDAGQTIDPKKPNPTATFDLQFSPTAAGTVVGEVTVVGRVMNGDPEARNVTITTAFSAEVVPAVVPTPTPTSTSTATPNPTATSTPSATSTAGPGGSGAGSGGSGTGAGSSGIGAGGTRGGGSLAQTGADVLPGVVFVVLALLGGTLAVVRVRQAGRRQAR